MKRLRKYILNLVVLVHCATACGQDQTPVTSQGQAKPAVGDATVQAKDTQGKKTAPKAPESLAIAVEKAGGLPACDDTRTSQLAYAKAEHQFYVCDQGDWAEIDLQGTPGKDGAKGADGKDGSTAASVQATQAPAPALAANETSQPGTDLIWSKSTTMVSFDVASVTCHGDRRLPTELELKIAIASGYIPASPISVIWSETGTTAETNNPDVIRDHALERSLGIAVSGATYCVRNP